MRKPPPIPKKPGERACGEAKGDELRCVLRRENHIGAFFAFAWPKHKNANDNHEDREQRQQNARVRDLADRCADGRADDSRDGEH